MQKRKQQRIYEINPQAVQEVEAWARQMTELWNERFDRLEGLFKGQEAPSPKPGGRKEEKHAKGK